MIFFEGHWQTGVPLEDDYWVCEGSGNHVTWGALGENENIYPGEGGLGKYVALYYLKGCYQKEYIDFTFVSTGRLKFGVVF